MYQKNDLIIHGKYRVEKLLGKGNFGAVYRVRDLIVDDIVAIKRLYNPDNRSAYEKEIRVLAKLRKAPYAITISHYEFDESGAMVLVMDYMSGGSLEHILGKNGPLSEEDALVLLQQMVKALKFSHGLKKPILHRDIKPANILREGTDWYLGDWGIGGSKDGSSTKGAGTFLYNAPEVFEGKRYPESDIYSLGMTIFHALTGQPGFTGSDAMVMMGHLQKTVDFNEKGVSNSLQPLLQSMLEKDPKKRPSAAELLNRLKRSEGTLLGLENIPVSTRPKLGDVYVEPITGMEFVWVPGGVFQMGDVFGDEDAYEDELPVHEVELVGYWLGKYAVTQGEWEKVMGSNPSTVELGDRYPVETVSWNDVQYFIKQLNRKGSETFRMPTEAEWEYACRSRGKKERYSGGNDVDLVAWHGRNRWGKTHPLGEKQPNGIGLYDMSGSVWEWVGDWYDKDFYVKSPRDNPKGPSDGSYRVLRGGCWDGHPDATRSANRGWNGPEVRSSSLGFRLLKVQS